MYTCVTLCVCVWWGNIHSVCVCGQGEGEGGLKGIQDKKSVATNHDQSCPFLSSTQKQKNSRNSELREIFVSVLRIGTDAICCDRFYILDVEDQRGIFSST